MKKIGIITHHNSFNYGASLQAFATIKFFQANGYDPYIINYRPEYIQAYETFGKTFKTYRVQGTNLLRSLLSSCIKVPSYKQLKKRFDGFTKERMPLTREYLGIDELKEDIPEVDIFCTGSDQVWNNYYTGCFDDAYFLQFVPEGYPCIALASSFGKSYFNKSDMCCLKEKLTRYDKITVRELEGIQIVEKLGLKASLMLDPTLLVDENVWKTLCSRLNYGRYILVYQLHGDSDTLMMAKMFANKKNIKVINIITMYHQIRLGCKNIIIPTIEEFLSLFYNAEYVFTDSFHGTVFSHIFEKKVAVTLPKKFSNRITTLLKELGTESFILEDLKQWENKVDSISYLDVKKKMRKIKSEKESEIISFIS